MVRQPRIGLIPAATVAFLICLIGRTADAVDITVNDAGDTLHATGCAAAGTGTCTLRDAITFANSNPGPDVIRVTGVVVRPRSALPPITESATVDGTYYLGQSPGVIDGLMAGPVDGLVLAADQISLFGLVVRGFEGSGIVILGANSTLGRDSVGPCTLGCPIGTVTASDNLGNGIEIRGGKSNRLASVYAQLNGANGVYVHAGATSNSIGASDGLLFRPGSAAFNRLAGVRIGESAADIATQGNTIDLGGLFGNGGPGIDLAGDGATPNDTLDADTGPNGFQNFPTVTSAVTNANDTVTVSGTYSGAANASFTLRFYRADTGENNFQDNVSVTTDASGFAAFSAVLSYNSYPSHPILPANVSIPLLASATNGGGSSSELSGPMLWAQPKNLSFYTVSPCRFLDTREAGSGGPSLFNGRPLQLSIPLSCGVPVTAQALVVNVTVTNATAGGHVLVAANPWATDVSTINFRAGQTRANGAVVTLQAASLAAIPVLEGSLSGTVDLILDVSGYLE